MHLDGSDDLLVVLDPQLGAFGQIPAALDGLSDLRPLLVGLSDQQADLLNHLHDFALGFVQRIADLLAHHLDVGPGVSQFVAHRFAPRHYIRQLGLGKCSNDSKLSDALPGLDPVQLHENDTGKEDEKREEHCDLHPNRCESRSKNMRQRKP